MPVLLIYVVKQIDPSSSCIVVGELFHISHPVGNRSNILCSESCVISNPYHTLLLSESTSQLILVCWIIGAQRLQTRPVAWHRSGEHMEHVFETATQML